MSKVNFLIQKVEDSMVNLVHLAGVDMPADILTKPLITATHQQHTTRMLEGSYPLLLSVSSTSYIPSSTKILPPAYEPTMPLKSSLKITTQNLSTSSLPRIVHSIISQHHNSFMHTLKWKHNLTYTQYFNTHDAPDVIYLYKINTRHHHKRL